jgi:hypothetical protein
MAVDSDGDAASIRRRSRPELGSTGRHELQETAMIKVVECARSSRAGSGGLGGGDTRGTPQEVDDADASIPIR